MELIRTEIPYCEPSHEALSSFSESTDAIVPDAFPDIGRIICAAGAATVKDELPQTDRILVSGMVNAVVLYQPEGESGVRKLSVPLSFAHIEEARGVTAESVCFVRCRVGGVTAKAVNSRKVSVTAQLCVETDVYERRTVELTEQIDPQADALEILSGQETIPLLEDAAVREFTLLDDLEIPGGERLEIVTASCELGPAGCQAMNGRAALKGDARLTLLALDDTGAFQVLHQTIPYTQIVECEDVQEGQTLAARLAVRHLDCMFAEGGVLSVGVGVGVLLLREGRHTLQTIRDLYHVHRTLELEERQLALRGCHLCGPFTGESTAVMPVSRPASEIISADAVCAGLQQSDDHTIRVSAQLSVLYRDADGVICSASRQLPVNVPIPASEASACVQDAALQVSATPSGEGNLNLRLTVSGQLTERPVLTLRDITALSAGAPRKPCGGVDTTLILRYIHAPEPLWEIAKQYASTVQAIRRANALAEHTESVSDAMLLIPVYNR